MAFAKVGKNLYLSRQMQGSSIEASIMRLCRATRNLCKVSYKEGPLARAVRIQRIIAVVMETRLEHHKSAPAGWWNNRRGFNGPGPDALRWQRLDSALTRTLESLEELFDICLANIPQEVS